MELTRHIVLVSGAAPDSKSVAAIMSVMRISNAIPMLIANHADRVKNSEDPEVILAEVQNDLAKADGVIVMGNDLDICPSDYGQKKHPATRSEKTSQAGLVRALYEYKLIEEALNQKLPMLCICGGMQRLNVLLGGSLHQHVPDLVGSAYHNQALENIAPFIPVQYIKVVPGTILASISQEVPGLFTPTHEALLPGVFMDNSFHHQAVNRVGKGLIASAYSIEPDHKDLRIVQAIETDPDGPYAGQFILGLQWHPEFGASDVSIRSLQQFNEIVKRHAKIFPKNISPEQALATTASSLISDSLKISGTGAHGTAFSQKSKSGHKKPGGKSR